MASFSNRHILKEVEAAIKKKDHAHIYALGMNMVRQSANDNSWLEAATIIARYLLKNPAHIKNAIDLSTHTALAAPDDGHFQIMTSDCLIVCINVLTDVKERIEAAHNVVQMAQKNSPLMLLCLEVMLNNIAQVDDFDIRTHYIKIVIHFSPDGHMITARAELLMREVNQNNFTPEIKKQGSSPLIGFVKDHKNISELFEHQRI